MTNSTPIANASITFWEFNNDCQQTTCPPAGQSFLVQYDTDPSDISFSNATTVGTFTPPEPGYEAYSLPIGSLPAGTYYFRITATGTDGDGTGQYVLDNVTITGSH
jgi:Tfp pilus assembly protein PilX